MKAELASLKTERASFTADNEQLRLSIQKLNLRIESLTIELNTTGQAKNDVKNDNEDLHEKILTLEEELYESK